MNNRAEQGTENQDAPVMFSELSSDDTNTEFEGGQHIINHRVRVKYRIQDNTGPMHSNFSRYARLVYPTTKLLGSIVHEHISEDESGNYWVTADFFINETEYAALRRGSTPHNMKNPATLDSEHLPASLRQKIETWQAVKHAYCGEVKVLGSEKISPYFIGSFHAEKPCHITQEGKLMLLTGDALTGLAFMRASNNGFHNSTYIGDLVATLDTSSLEEIGERFRLYTRLRYKKERVMAAIKTAILDFILWFLQISNQVPWQTNRFRPEEINNMIAQMNDDLHQQLQVNVPLSGSGELGLSTDTISPPLIEVTA